MVLLLALACTPDRYVVRPPTDPEPLDPRWLELVGEAEDWRLRMGAEAMAIAVVENGRLLHAEGLGEVDGRPIEAGTVFRWASVSKPHVALAVHQLVDEGVLSLDDPLSRWLPAFGATYGGSAVDPTLRELLDHTAGFPDYLDWACKDTEAPLTDTFDADWSPALQAPPGALHNYSNTHFTGLGAVLEVVTGEAFPDLMAHRVFEPLGMRTATYRAEEAEALGGATGFGGAAGGLAYDLSDYDCATSRPPAWLHASVLDIARSMEHLLGPDAPESLHDGMARAVDTRWWGDGDKAMGAGFYATTYRGTHRLWSHDGWVTGFAAHIALLPDEGLGIALVVNREDANTGGLRNKALDLFLGIETDAPAHDPLYTDVAYQSRWAGTYRQPLRGFAPDHAVGDLVVEVYDGVLAITFPELPPRELFQLDGDAFAYVVDDVVYEVRFVESFGARYLAHRYYVATRIDDEAPATRSPARRRAPGPPEPSRPTWPPASAAPAAR